jgi:hypothetical protein
LSRLMYSLRENTYQPVCYPTMIEWFSNAVSVVLALLAHQFHPEIVVYPVRIDHLSYNFFVLSALNHHHPKIEDCSGISYPKENSTLNFSPTV